jgi:hypothetical protein
MKPELCDYMCGHESKSGTGARYGKRKVPVLEGDGIIPIVRTENLIRVNEAMESSKLAE